MKQTNLLKNNLGANDLCEKKYYFNVPLTAKKNLNQFNSVLHNKKINKK